MKYVFSTFLVSLFLLLVACGGGSSSSDGGGDTMDGANPQDISGTYSGTWTGSGTDESGTFTCGGTFTLNVSQSGSTIVVTFDVVTTSGTGIGQCTEAFNFTGNGTYGASTGELHITSTQDGITASVNGFSGEPDGKITLSGTWSTTDTASSDVIASGTWTAERS